MSLTLQGEEVGIDSTEQEIRTVEETITKYRDYQFEASFQKLNDLIIVCKIPLLARALGQARARR